MDVEFWDDLQAALNKPDFPKPISCADFIDAFRRNPGGAFSTYGSYKLTIRDGLIVEIIPSGGRHCIVIADPSPARRDLFLGVWTTDALGVLGLEKGQTVTAHGVLPPRFANMGRPIMVGAVRR